MPEFEDQNIVGSSISALKPAKASPIDMSIGTRSSAG